MATSSDMPERDPFSALATRKPESTGMAEQPLRPPTQLLATIEADLKTQGDQPRPVTRNARLVVSAALLLVGLLSTSLKAWAREPALLTLGGALLAFLLGTLVLGGFLPGGSLRVKLELRRGLLTGLVLSLGLVLAAKQTEVVSWGEFLGPTHLPPAIGCSLHCLWTGGLCLTGLLYVWRRTDPFSPGLTGGLMGVVGGLIANLGVGLGCASVEGMHLMLAHGASVVLLGVLGWALGRRLLTP